jgi:hypothetical protein
MDRAMGLADEIRWFDGLGNHVNADEAARTIDELVGRFVDGRVVWPQVVADVAKRPMRGDSHDRR